MVNENRKENTLGVQRAHFNEEVEVYGFNPRDDCRSRESGDVPEEYGGEQKWQKI